jgi:hypothetical protein
MMTILMLLDALTTVSFELFGFWLSDSKNVGALGAFDLDLPGTEYGTSILLMAILLRLAVDGDRK